MESQHNTDQSPMQKMTQMNYLQYIIDYCFVGENAQQWGLDKDTINYLIIMSQSENINETSFNSPNKESVLMVISWYK